MSEFKIVVCPSCEKENHLDADSIIEDSSCEFCHAPLQLKTDSQLTAIDTPAHFVDPQTLPYSAARPFWYVAVMFIVTFGLYSVVWFYRSWQELLLRYQLKGYALVNAIFFPFCLWSFYKYAFLYGETGGYKSKWESYNAASFFFIVNAIGRSIARYEKKLDEKLINEHIILLILSWGLFFVVLYPLREGVNAMNAGVNKTYNYNRMRTKFSPASIIFIVIGSTIWILQFMGLIITIINSLIK